MIDGGNISFDKKGQREDVKIELDFVSLVFFSFKGLQESMFGRNLYSCSRLFVAC